MTDWELGSLRRVDIWVKLVKVDVDRESGIREIHVPNSGEIVIV